ncbi:MAG: site-specific integrase [Desulfobacterales bacterium]|nr:site-specific integrase [Desulfobacterales bacterium]
MRGREKLGHSGEPTRTGCGSHNRHQEHTLQLHWWIKKQGYAKDSTIPDRVGQIRRLFFLGADLYDPESVKDILAQRDDWKNSYKSIIAAAYSCFLASIGQTWTKPRYKPDQSFPFIPLEEEIDALVQASGKIMSCFLQGLKETGADPGELLRLEWHDINWKPRTVAINHPVKRHSPRILDVSVEWLRMLSAMPKRPSGRLFSSYRSMVVNYHIQRERVSRKLGNPRLKKIKFTTFRHWFGTTKYHETKDIIYVKRLLGHKNIQNTMIYINLESALFKETSDEFCVRVAETKGEATSFMEAGFEYVGKIHGAEMFRKRK